MRKQEMGKKLDWETNSKKAKPARRLADEKKWRDEDAAARWLRKYDEKHPGTASQTNPAGTSYRKSSL
jgi:hypothetical protein